MPGPDCATSQSSPGTHSSLACPNCKCCDQTAHSGFGMSGSQMPDTDLMTALAQK